MCIEAGGRLYKEGFILGNCVFCGYLMLFELSPPGRESISLYPSEFGKVPGEAFAAVVLGAAGLALALCRPVALTILTIAALAQVLRHVVSMEVS